MNSIWDRIDGYVAKFLEEEHAAHRKKTFALDVELWVRRNVPDHLQYDVRRLVEKAISYRNVVE